jgi:Ni/Co efflux regulator RcnB
VFKKLITAAAAASVVASAGAAAAQPWGYGYGDYGYRHRDHARGDYRPGYGYGDYRHRHWRQGERLYGPYRGEWVDYRAYHLRRPPYGYEYRRTDAGDIVLAAVATGLIASVILNNRY